MCFSILFCHDALMYNTFKFLKIELIFKIFMLISLSELLRYFFFRFANNRPIGRLAEPSEVSKQAQTDLAQALRRRQLQEDSLLSGRSGGSEVRSCPHS